ncbi:UNVERIFIED_CONTAM: hypothetical protein HDU68_005359 [Siphonaria sp. JEL0065]|nr:hypothetical protein HDU68_005359 [Siphonaria sp. JEL0065]
MGEIIGGVVGGLVFIGGLAGWLWYSKQKTRLESKAEIPNTSSKTVLDIDAISKRSASLLEAEHYHEPISVIIPTHDEKEKGYEKGSFLNNLLRNNQMESDALFDEKVGAIQSANAMSWNVEQTAEWAAGIADAGEILSLRVLEHRLKFKNLVQGFKENRDEMRHLMGLSLGDCMDVINAITELLDIGEAPPGYSAINSVI